MRKIVSFAVALLTALAAALFLFTGRAPGPTIAILSPADAVGAATPMQIAIDAPGAKLSAVRITFEQNGTSTELFTLGADPARSGVTMTVEPPDRVRLARQVGRASIPGITAGPARLRVTATRPTFMGLRHATSEASRDLQVRLEPPRVSVVSIHHYINVGGSEMAVYRASPADVDSGVRVGDQEFPGYPAAGARADPGAPTDPELRVAFFALDWDRPVGTPIVVFARDATGAIAETRLESKVFPKPFKKSRIDLNDDFLGRVVPAILAGTTEVAPSGTLVEKFVVINGELRRKNAETIRGFAVKTDPTMLWKGDVFFPFTNSKAESAFADARTYIYQGREVDHQVHLGFDLASFAQTAVVSSNRGRVLFADNFGIYGNCVILDHGMGVQSLYAHLSVIDVKPGDMVEKAQPLGKTGITGLAGGDHLHFTMLVNGHMVNPVEWWDPHWIADRIVRKLRD